MPALAGAGHCDDQVPLDVRTVTVDGIKGNWLDPASMNRVTFVLTECLPGYKELIAKQGRLLDLQTKTVNTSSKAITAAEGLAAEEHDRGQHWKEAYTDEHLALKDEREAHAGVLHSGVFWFAVGVAAGAATTIGIAFAYAKAVGVK